MKNIFLALLLYYSLSTSAQTIALERCEQSYDTVGYCYNGEVMIPYQYKQGSEFSGEAAAVTNYQNKCALINSQGKGITPFIYDELVPCYYFPGRFACKLGNNVGIIDDMGREIIPVKYQGINFQSDFLVDGMMAYFDSNYCFVFAQNGKYGALNYFGKQICNFEYEQIWSDYHWLDGQRKPLPIALKKDGKVWLMHANGAIDTKEYDGFLGYWGHDCVMRKGKKIIFFNSITWSVVKTHINADAELTERLFFAEEKRNRGVIDSTGKICIPIIYKNISFVSFDNKISPFRIERFLPASQLFLNFLRPRSAGHFSLRHRSR